MPILKLTVNGTPHAIEIAPSRSLAEVLRYDLGLTGTKIGCNEAECGACTVIVNGNSVDSCIYPALKAQNATVTTIEGMAAQWGEGRGARGEVTTSPHASRNSLSDLHPLQQAFVTHGATQCGFCTPGLIMQVSTLLETNPDPDRRRDQALPQGHALPLHRLQVGHQCGPRRGRTDAYGSAAWTRPAGSDHAAGQHRPAVAPP